MSDQWTFLTNHGHVILYLSKHADATVREIADKIGITERAVLKIIADLSQEGYIKIQKNGRNNVYTLDLKKTLRHDLEKSCKIEKFLKLI